MKQSGGGGGRGRGTMRGIDLREVQPVPISTQDTNGNSFLRLCNLLSLCTTVAGMYDRCEQLSLLCTKYYAFFSIVCCVLLCCHTIYPGRQSTPTFRCLLGAPAGVPTDRRKMNTGVFFFFFFLTFLLRCLPSYSAKPPSLSVSPALFFGLPSRILNLVNLRNRLSLQCYTTGTS